MSDASDDQPAFAAPPAPDRCARCERSLGDGPRLRGKDKSSICIGCLTARERQKLAAKGVDIDALIAQEAGRSGSAVAPVPPPPSAGRPRGGHRTSDDVRLASDGAGDALPLEGVSTQEPARRNCPGCGRLFNIDVGVCSSCGYDERKGLASSSKVETRVNRISKKDGVACRKCGYDLRAVTGHNCPECGVPLREAVAGNTRERHARATVRDAYIKPLLMFAIGGAILGIMAMAYDGFSGVFATFAGMFVGAIIATAVYLFFCLIHLGFDLPIHLVTLNLLGIYAVSDATFAGLSLLPIPILPTLAWFIVYIGLLSEMLDMEIGESIVYAIVCFVAKLFVGGAIVSAMM